MPRAAWLLLCVPLANSLRSETTFGRRAALAAGGWALGGCNTLPMHAALPAAASLPLCDPCVTTVKSARGQDVTLVGTAHISEDSASLVSAVIRDVQPDVVMIELDQTRAAKLIGRASSSLKLIDPERARMRGEDPTSAAVATSQPITAQRAPQPDATTTTYGIGRVAGRVIRGDLEEAKAEAVGAGLSTLYKRLDAMGFQSGQEFVVAVREADALGASLLLGDRDARQTIRRLRDALAVVLANPKAFDSLAPPPAALMAAAGNDGNGDFTRENVMSAMAVLKQRENVRALTAYLKSNVPPLYEALIAERDRYMANSILGCDARRVVAIVGLAHVDGIEASILAEAGTAARVAKPRACTLQTA